MKGRDMDEKIIRDFEKQREQIKGLVSAVHAGTDELAAAYRTVRALREEVGLLKSQRNVAELRLALIDAEQATKELQ